MYPPLATLLAGLSNSNIYWQQIYENNNFAFHGGPHFRFAVMSDQFASTGKVFIRQTRLISILWKICDVGGGSGTSHHKSGTFNFFQNNLFKSVRTYCHNPPFTEYRPPSQSTFFNAS